MKKRKWLYAGITAALILVSYNIGRISNNQQTYNVNLSSQTKDSKNADSSTVKPKHFHKTGLPNFKPETYKNVTYPTIELQKEYARLNNPELSGKDLAKIIYEREH